MPAAPASSRAAFDTPPDLGDPSGTLVAWFTDPPGAVVQFAREERGMVEHAQWLVGPALTALLERFPDQPLVFVMDFGAMQGRDPAVRPIIVEAAKKLRTRIARSILVAPRSASAIYLSSLHVSISLLRVFGVAVELQPATTAFAGLRPAPPATGRPGQP